MKISAKIAYIVNVDFEVDDDVVEDVLEDMILSSADDKIGEGESSSVSIISVYKNGKES